MFKRIFDFALSLVGLLLLLPLFLIIIAFIVIDSKGAPFYNQLRVGRNNIDFKLLKFRTMRQNSAAKGLLTIGSKDARITKIGYFLRKYKLDELPQLINVVLGEMSLVGPRPEVRKYVKYYNSSQMKVLNVRPGITDMASIKYKDENRILAEYDNPEQAYIDIVMPDKIKLNLAYLKESQSVLGSLKIIFYTFYQIIK